MDLGAWQWAFGVTDRERPAVSCASAVVHHLYMQQLSWLWTPIRTFDPRRGPGDDAHTSWVDLLGMGHEDGVYEVERILRARVYADGRESFFVRWWGFSAEHDTWVPREELAETAPEVLRRFDLCLRLTGRRMATGGRWTRPQRAHPLTRAWRYGAIFL